MTGEGRPAGLERRRAERVPMPPRGGPVAVVGARLINASAYGMMIESLVPMERDAVLKLRLVVAGQNADVEARVAACSLLSSGRRHVYGIGLEFTSLAEDLRQRLIAAIAAPVAAAS